MPTQRQILEAMMLDSIGTGQLTGGGGAADNARARDKMAFAQSQLGMLLAGTPMFDQMFEQKYYGGAIPFKYGERPDPTLMKRYMDKIMGAGLNDPGRSDGRAKKKDRSDSPAMMGQAGQALVPPQYAGAPGQYIPGRGYMPSPLELLLLASQQDFDARNAAVKKREDEIRASKDALYNRTMDRVGNWGKTQEADIKENYEDMLNSQKAALAERGLANATTLPSFEGEKKRKEERALRELSEQVDERYIRHDIPLTQDKENFVERIVDRGSSMQDIMAMAQQLGLAGLGGIGTGGSLAPVGPSTGTSMRTTGPSSDASMQAGGTQATGPQVTMTPWGPVQKASYYPEARQPIATNIFPGNPLNPMSTLAATNAMIQGLVPQPGGIVPNAYPQNNRPRTAKPNPADGPKQMTPQQSQSGYPLDLASILAASGAVPPQNILTQSPFAPGRNIPQSPVRQSNPYIPGGGLTGLLQRAMGLPSRLSRSPQTRFGPEMLRR